ncbi:MAG: hypothetical protein P8J25_06370 [Porticoccaceae bacterium]|nr:hypothetical protein [Porticoccaceae bacterium]
MVNQFILNKLFSAQDLSRLMETFGFKRMSEDEFEAALQRAFSDYILLSLSELGAEAEDHRRLYLEAQFHLQKSMKLLEGLPHPAGKMAYRISTMNDTLDKLIEGRSDFSAERATRFVEKNLVRQLRDIWIANTSTPFHAGSDNSGRNPRDFLLCCFSAAGDQYPELTWFKLVDAVVVDQLIKSIKR